MKSATELRKWASVALSNQMRDYLRHEKRFQTFAPLFEERCKFFKEKTGMDLTIAALNVIAEWCQNGHEHQKLQGLALRHRFVDGMTREKIADQLNRSVHEVRKAIKSGIIALRVALDDSPAIQTS
jgi:DNA-directed RNA polymerase specialized sigma24 family protein